MMGRYEWGGGSRPVDFEERVAPLELAHDLLGFLLETGDVERRRGSFGTGELQRTSVVNGVGRHKKRHCTAMTNQAEKKNTGQPSGKAVRIKREEAEGEEMLAYAIDGSRRAAC
jgi:hypothetical protein